jgi:hypothetical protein
LHLWLLFNYYTSIIAKWEYLVNRGFKLFLCALMHLHNI